MSVLYLVLLGDCHLCGSLAARRTSMFFVIMLSLCVRLCYCWLHVKHFPTLLSMNSHFELIWIHIDSSILDNVALVLSHLGRLLPIYDFVCILNFSLYMTLYVFWSFSLYMTLYVFWSFSLYMTLYVFWSFSLCMTLYVFRRFSLCMTLRVFWGSSPLICQLRGLWPQMLVEYGRRLKDHP